MSKLNNQSINFIKETCLKKLMLVGFLFVVGCTTFQRSPDSVSSIYSTIPGEVTNNFRNFLQSKKIVTDCEGNSCSFGPIDVSCTKNMSTSQTECMWMIKTEGRDRADNEVLNNKESDYIFRVMRNSKVPEICAEGKCSVNVLRISCYVGTPAIEQRCALSM